jgi:flagellar biosynthesis GTPase FlhF
MLLTLSLLQPNPFRDFKVDPIDDVAVDVLKQSISEDGFWGGVTARWNDAIGMYEIAAGHHRVKAAIAAGIDRAEIFVGDFDDHAMVRIYGTENASQRGNGSTAVAGTVAGAIRYLAKAQFLSAEFRSKGNRGGPSDLGRDEILSFLEGVPNVSRECVAQQLANLKASGDYARIIAEVEAEVKAEVEREQERIRKAMEAEEAARKQAEEAAAAAAEKARKDAEAAERRAAEAKRKADESARAAAEAERRAAEARRAEAEKRREEEAKASAERYARMQEEAAKFEAMKQSASKAAAKAAEREVTFDFEGVAKHLKNENQVRVFRDCATAEGIRPYLPVANQAAVAEAIVGKAAELGRELSGAFIKEYFTIEVLGMKQQQREFSKREQEELLRRDLQARAKTLMDNFSRNCRGMTAAGTHLSALMKDWPKDLPFPITGEFRAAISHAANVIEKLAKEV